MQTSDLKSVPADLPVSQGATTHSPSMITAAVGIIKSSFLHFYLISLAKSPTTSRVPLAEPSATSGWGHGPAPSLVTQSIPVLDSTITL